MACKSDSLATKACKSDSLAIWAPHVATRVALQLKLTQERFPVGIPHRYKRNYFKTDSKAATPLPTQMCIASKVASYVARI